ncbi:MAG: hypothetical protein KGI50_02225 [Patescibacteria group bacterium]|nr:hypothetical protein [Patescibacteria group bacterium]MDE2437838.1 hypothetical protein [Patescibacteria group bacterium]
MFELAQRDREAVIMEILAFLPPEKREEAQKLAQRVTNCFEAQDANALSVLYRAAEKGRFDEYAQKLQEYHEKEGKNVPVDTRSSPRNGDIIVLRALLKKEEEIRRGEREPSDRNYLPRRSQNLVKHPGAIKMELFFFDCFQDICGKL